MADDSRISCACGYTPPTHTHAEDCPMAADRNAPTARYVNADRLIERLEQQVASFEQLIPHVWQAMRYRECHEEVTRKGQLQPCDKAAVAVRRDPDGGRPYPVCAYHCRGDMVPLWQLKKAGEES